MKKNIDDSTFRFHFIKSPPDLILDIALSRIRPEAIGGNHLFVLFSFYKMANA